MTSGLYGPLRPDPPPEALARPTRALAIGAHPDDAEFGAGGTLARWAGAGCEVTLLVITDGSKGSWDRDVAPDELAQRRQQEQQAAADVLGVTNVVFFEQSDGELEYSLELRRRVALEIRRWRPEVVISHDPWALYEIHPDHRATGWAAVDGVVGARDHLFYPDQPLDAHRPDWLLLWLPAQADYWEDITSTIGTKINALLMHASQAKTTMAGAEDGDSQRQHFTDRVTGWAAEQGKPVGLALAESFKRLKP